MEAKYNPETTDSTSPQYKLAIEWASAEIAGWYETNKELLEKQFLDYVVYGKSEFKTSLTSEIVQTVSLPKLCTIETYDELIKYVEEMYVNGMILGDEFVMRPCDDQREKLTASIIQYLKRTGIGNAKYFRKDELKNISEIRTSFGVKIIIK
jgi:hypothetical protein